jgi:hypothetical protein
MVSGKSELVANVRDILLIKDDVTMQYSAGEKEWEKKRRRVRKGCT